MSPLLPDPSRVGGIDWLEATRGHLTAAERRRARVEVARGVGAVMRTRLALLLGRRAVEHLDLPSPPDSQLATDAIERCAQQSPAIAGHSWRTWAYGRLLAQIDGVPQLDDELFFVAALLHDAALADPVDGEDFTLRSAQCAGEISSTHCSPDDTRRVQDAIAAHCTPGADLATAGAEGFYLQSGATLDLAGLRLHELHASTVGSINTKYPRLDVVAEIRRLIAGEAKAVPDGRMAILRGSGFGVSIRLAPAALRALD